jgi:hypothetical protein
MAIISREQRALVSRGYAAILATLSGGFSVKNVAAAYIETIVFKVRNTATTQVTVDEQVRNSAGDMVTVK